jgi:hypothetical protein
MTPPDFTMILTSDRSMTKLTGGRGRPTRDEIARLAYTFYESRGRRDGRDVDDWIAAEQELTHHFSGRDTMNATSSRP